MTTSEGITILGGGPVGLAAALALADGRLPGPIRVVEAGRLPAPVADDAPMDLRVYALSPATRRLLESVSAWQGLRSARVTPVTAMHVRGDQPAGQLELAAREPLAWIVEHHELVAALADRVRETDIVVIENARATQWTAPVDEAGPSLLCLAQGDPLQQSLIIGADGAQSWLRDEAGLQVQRKDYGSLGVVANFHCERPHQGIARQWFRGRDVLAWLPLRNNHISIVWSVQAEEGKRLVSLTGDALAAEVSAAGGDVLGRLTSVSAAAAFPLRRLLAPVSVAEGLALIGDAAHAIHPLAGQGANLGFGDVVALRDSLQSRGPLTHCGSLALLRRTERARREDVAAMAALTDQLKALFEIQSGEMVHLRNAGMSWVNRQGALKHAMMRAAMG